MLYRWSQPGAQMSIFSLPVCLTPGKHQLGCRTRKTLNNKYEKKKKSGGGGETGNSRPKSQFSNNRLGLEVAAASVGGRRTSILGFAHTWFLQRWSLEFVCVWRGFSNKEMWSRLICIDLRSHHIMFCKIFSGCQLEAGVRSPEQRAQEQLASPALRAAGG